MSREIFEPVLPAADEIDLFKESSRRLAALGERELSVTITDADKPVNVRLPAVVVRLLNDILGQMAAGNAVTLMPVHAELTTQQAAELLGVSRPFVVQLIESRKLPCRRIGTHRRIMFKDLMAYREQSNRERQSVLDELAAEAQAHNMGY